MEKSHVLVILANSNSSNINKGRKDEGRLSYQVSGGNAMKLLELIEKTPNQRCSLYRYQSIRHACFVLYLGGKYMASTSIHCLKKSDCHLAIMNLPSDNKNETEFPDPSQWNELWCSFHHNLYQ